MHYTITNTTIGQRFVNSHIELGSMIQWFIGSSVHNIFSTHKAFDLLPDDDREMPCGMFFFLSLLLCNSTLHSHLSCQKIEWIYLEICPHLPLSKKMKIAKKIVRSSQKVWLYCTQRNAYWCARMTEDCKCNDFFRSVACWSIFRFAPCMHNASTHTHSWCFLRPFYNVAMKRNFILSNCVCTKETENALQTVKNSCISCVDAPRTFFATLVFGRPSEIRKLRCIANVLCHLICA